MRTVLGIITVAIVATPVTAQNDPSDAIVGWQPERPEQGTLIYIVVEPADSAIAAEGSLAGQPLHFSRDRIGTLRALAAVPVNALETIPLSLALIHDADTTHRMVRIPVESANFDSERLTVSSRFSTPPDSATSARIRREGGQSVGVSIRSHDTPRLWQGEWVRPRPSRITSDYGTGRVFNGAIQSRHMGIDFDGDYGDPIVAGNRGVVALVGDFYYAGNVVYLDHGEGLVTIYMHMSEVLVNEGDVVERGQRIGLVGATGRVTGPHVHWVARYGRISVNGLSLFDLDVTPLPDVADATDAGRNPPSSSR